MLINWFTVAAQAINFLILVWLLKRFLYKPILHAIDEREKGIAAQLADAENKKAEALKDRDDFAQRNKTFDLERAALLKKATDDANSERQRLLDEARKDADALRAKRQEGLRLEQASLNQAITRWTQKEVFSIARKTLSDLAGASLEERMGNVFVERVRGLTGPAKEQLAAAFKSSNQTVSVHSTFDLPPAQRSAIDSAIKESFAPGAQVQFETAPELISGVELSTNGHKIAWSIADYLSSLEKSAGKLLDPKTKPDARPDAKPDPKAESKPDAKADAKPEAKTVPKPGPKREPQNGPAPVAVAPKADH